MGWWGNQYHEGLSFTWDLLYICNYRCPYCWWDPNWDKLERTYPMRPAEDWIRCWGRVHERYGMAKIDILGGEPFLYRDFPELIRRLTSWHRIELTSNLSVSRTGLERFLDPLSPERFHMNLSFHPHFAQIDDFLQKAEVVKARGFDPGVLVVSYPSYLDELPAIRQTFRASGFPFTTLVYRGEYNGRPYPEGFSSEQRLVISENIEAEGAQRASYKKYQLDRDRTLGRLCYTGHVYANVKPTGEVFRCGRDQTVLKPIGNIFDPDFRLSPGPTPCPFQNCSCQEYVYISEEYEPWRSGRGREREALI